MAIRSPPILIRNFEPGDLVDVTVLANSSMTEYYGENLIHELYVQWPEAFLVAESGKEIVGFICGSQYSRSESRVLLLAVRRDSRRYGIGRTLMERFEKISRDSGMMGIRLEVRKDNEGGIAFYRGLGFSVTATLIAYYSDLSDAFVMWKLL
ncbi:MAG: GNAT family N-acetyltransferase [Candidatus Thermoplasmatota archaeon]|jgi:ribosomal-protein-alanine N-acetyltransferase|nr:GNAT family N-acetyltransferase [Candidatus Thermoplasmatota archaeon]